MNSASRKNVLTIREAVQQSLKDGIPVSEHSLRLWTKRGIIPTCKAGNKFLIYYPNLVAYITGENVTTAVGDIG